MAGDDRRPEGLDGWVPDIPWLGVVVADLANGLVLRANPAFLEIIGRSEADVTEGRVDVMSVTQRASAEATRKAAEQLKKSGKMTPIEKAYVRPDGAVRQAWVTGLRPSPESSFGVSFVLDVTEQRATVEQLRESEERAKRFAEASFEGLFLHDRGTVIDTNDVLPAMFRTTREAMLGRTAYEFTDPSCHELMTENVRRQYELPYELTGLRADGTTFPVEVLGKPIPAGGRRIRVTAVRDLTERKRTEAALRQAEAALREAQKLESLGLLAGGIAHDFNNLLTIVLGAAAIATRHTAPGSPAREAVGEIERAARRAAELTRQMLVYSGRSPRTVGSLGLNELVSDMAPLLTAPFSKKIQLELRLDHDLPPMPADRAQVQQVLMNLVTNAAEAIGDRPGCVRVSTRREPLGPGEVPSATPGERLAAGEYARLEVSDDGCGMDEATLGRIFDPFFTTKATGRGLGLSAMLGILRGHRAGLSIRTAPGEGTTFRVYFPLGTTPSSGLSRQAIPTAVGAHGAVLVVEDEPALRRSTRQLLASAGYLVLEASDGAEAVEVYRRHQPDVALVLLDLMMPVADGREALLGIRSLDPSARIVLTSGFDRHEAVRELGGQVQGFLPKPYDEKTLLEAVSQLIGPARAAR